jgi:hypothetical protein
MVDEMDVDPEVQDDEHHHRHRQCDPLRSRAHADRGEAADKHESCYLDGHRARHPPPPKASLDHARNAANQGWTQVRWEFYFYFFIVLFKGSNTTTFPPINHPLYRVA